VSEGRSSASGSQDEVRVAPAQEVLKKGDRAAAALVHPCTSHTVKNRLPRRRRSSQ